MKTKKKNGLDEMTDFTLVQRLFAPREVKRAEESLQKIRDDHEERIQKINEISDRIAKAEELEVKRPDGSITYSDLEDDIKREDLVSDPDVQVLNVEIEEGVEFPVHFHDETEILAVLKGIMILDGNINEIQHANCAVENGKIVMGPSSVAIIQPGSPHKVSIVEKLRVMALTLRDGDHDSLVENPGASDDVRPPSS